MKKRRTDWWMLFLLACLSPLAMAQKADARPQAGHLEAPLLVLPISMQDDEPRGPARLRDVLRQPYADTQVSGSRPYRLTPEERHRLREQLRSQPDGFELEGRP